MTNQNTRLGKILKQRRVTIPLTLQELARVSGVFPSYVGLIENGQRFPSARVLHRIAEPLGFRKIQLFTLADFLPSEPSEEVKSPGGRLDPYVAAVLSQEPVEIQRVVVAILTVLKNLAKGEK